MDRTILLLTILVFLMLLVFLYFLRKYQIKKLLEEEKVKRLKELDRQKTKLYTNFTHEFRTPLTVIQGMATRMLEESEIDDLQKTKIQRTNSKFIGKIGERADLILRNSANLLQLVNRLLEVSKKDSYEINYNWERNDVLPFIHYLLDNFKGLAQSKQILFSFNPAVESLIMDFDRQKMQDIIFNLLSNAIKFTLTRGEIEVKLDILDSTKQGGQKFMQLIVFNSGSGIREEDLEHIFDRYYQGEKINGSKNIPQGSGIGLAMIKELVEEWGGKIGAESHEQLGVTFTLTLPLESGQKIISNEFLFEKGVELENGIEKEFKSTARTKEDLPLVLLVEDNRDAAYYISEIIREKYEVLWLAEGEIALKKAYELLPDIIVSDVMMPGMSGFELANNLKNDYRTNHIPIVFLTARVDVYSRLSSLEHGADAYLTKPFRPKELLQVLHNMLELRKNWSKRFSGNHLKKTVGASPGSNAERIFEDAFLGKINGILERKLNDSSFKIPQLCGDMNMSQSQLFRKVKALTGQSISAYICQYRLKRSLDLLKNSEKSISEIAYEVGFTSPAYFTRQFSKRFNKPPSELRK